MKHERKYRSTGGKGRFSRFRFAPLLQILFAVLLIGGVVLLFWKWILPLWSDLRHGEVSFSDPTPDGSTPSPSPTAAPTQDPATAHDLYYTDLETAQQEIVLPEYQYATDVSVDGDTLVFAVGDYTPDGTAAFVRLCEYDTTKDTYSYLALPIENKSIRFPMRNDRWIVYFDSLPTGGGRLVAYNRITKEATGFKTVHVGLPMPLLDGDTVVWMERTGQTRDKLFACDLLTMETVTLDWLDNSDYGLSTPAFRDGTLFYADESGSLVQWVLATNEKTVLPVSTYVHDPKFNGTMLAYLSGNHGEDSDLYLYEESGPVCIAKGVVDFALGDTFVAYSRFDRTYVYFPDTDTTFCTTRQEEQSLLLAAGGKYLVWMDVTWRDKDIMEYMEITA